MSNNQPDQRWHESTAQELNSDHQVQNIEPEQKALHDLTSSKTGTFYFAYGSNLSAYQMSLRLPNSQSSSVPVAIARLDSYKWLICQRGYANVVKLSPDTPATHSSTVWGVLYNLNPDDEAILDRYEGHDEKRNPDPELNPNPKTQIERPYEQGNWDYNKHYLPVSVTKWLVDPGDFGVHVQGWEKPPQLDDGTNGTSVNLSGNAQTPGTTVRVLLYVDEIRIEPGRINFEYIGRMNRAIDESTALGYPQEWVDEVMRKFIVPDVYVRDDGYVGTDQGYVEAEATEAYDEVTENAVKAWKEKQGPGWS